MTLCVPDEVCSTLLAISDVTVACSSTAEEIEFSISLTLTMLSLIEPIAVTAPPVACEFDHSAMAVNEIAVLFISPAASLTPFNVAEASLSKSDMGFLMG